MFKLLFISLKLYVIAILLIFTSVAQANDVKIEVQLLGAPEGKTETLLSGLSIVRQQNSDRLSSRHIQKLHEETEAELTQMLQVYGYYHVQITSKLEQLKEDKWQADYQIELGEQVKLDQVLVTLDGTASEDVEFKKFIKTFPLKPADVFNHETYESAKKSLLRIGAERGYFDGELTTHKVEVNSEDNTASIYLNYSSGVRYHFSAVQFPPTVLTNELLLRLTPIKEDEPYLASQVLKLRNNLTNSGYFDDVAVRTLIDERHDGKVALDISFKPDARQRYTAGIGFGTDSGPRIGFGWENRYINKRGHRLSADAKFSQVTNSVAMDYRMPFWSETISDIGFNSEYKQQDTDTSESTSFAIGSYYKTKRSGWNETGALKLLNENYDVSEDSDTSLLLIPSISWARIWADDTIYTKQGGRLSLSLSGASEAILADTTFGQAVLRGKYIHSFTENGRFITRGTLGITEVTDFSKLPSSLRFFAGGDSSIRGFDFESLGPLGDDGEVEGGRYLAVGSVEYEQMIVGNWGAAIFSDFGNALNSWDDPLEYSVGVGVRWRSPIGLIRIDVAAGLSADNNPIGFHVVIGPDL
mgnify:CR=1 FL=1